MPKSKTRREMVTVNLFSGKAKKPFDTIKLPKLWIDNLEARAKREGVTVDAAFCEVVRDMMDIYQRAKTA